MTAETMDKEIFTVEWPGKIIFGAGKLSDLAAEAKSLGRKVFLVTTKDLTRLGLTERTRKILEAAGIPVIPFEDVQPDPTCLAVDQASALARKEKCDIVVALGGGSAIDFAKGVSVAATHDGPVWDYVTYTGANAKPVTARVLPVIAIPTTAGTASEVTAFSIVTDTARKKKMVIGGQFVGATLALADPLLTVAMPPRITASTGLDALTHAIEAYVSKWAMIPTDVLALKAIELIRKNIVTATKNGSCVEARSAMLLGSMMAGFAFTNAVLGLVHSIAHPLSAHFNLPHGVANAIGLPYVMEYNMASAPARFRDIAVALGIDVTGMSDAAAAQAAVDLVKSLNKELEIPTLKECGITRDMFDLIAEDALKEVSTLFNPRDPSKEDILAILEKAY